LSRNNRFEICLEPDYWLLEFVWGNVVWGKWWAVVDLNH